MYIDIYVYIEVYECSRANRPRALSTVRVRMKLRKGGLPHKRVPTQPQTRSCERTSTGARAQQHGRMQRAAALGSTLPDSGVPLRRRAAGCA